MPRPTKQNPERGDARTRLLEAARDVIRAQGFAATTVDDLCKAAGVTKGAFFHHFKDKEAMGVAAAERWSSVTGGLFAQAPYHAPADPRDRVLAYIAFRRAIIDGAPADFTCFAGTTVQEMFDASPAIRAACADAIFDHADTLVPDIAAAKAIHAADADWTPESLAQFTQAALQGAFILAKARGSEAGVGIARDMVDHLDRYVRMLLPADVRA